MSRQPVPDASVASETGTQALPVEALEQLLDATSAVVAAKDLTGRYLYVNRGFLELLGGSEADYLGRSDSEIFNAEMAAQLRANDSLVLAQRREMVFEERLVLGGEERRFSTRKYPLLSAAGEPWAICLTAEDVTEARRTDEALRRVALGISAASGPEVFDLTVASVAAVFGVDLAFVAALRQEGGTPRLATLAVCERGAKGSASDYAVAGTPCAQVLAHGFRYFSGSAAGSFPGDAMLAAAGYCSYAGYPLLDSSGTPAGILSICHTGSLPPAALVESILAIFAVRTAAELERSRMDQALRDSEASYRSIFEASEDCIFIHDFDTGAFVDVNPRACELYGYDLDTMLKLTPGELSSGEPPFTQADAERYLRQAKSGETVRFEWHRRNADGSTHWDEVCLKHVRLAGVDRILAVTRDITERKEREQALARSEDRLRATVSAALDCIVIMDSGGRIREFNPAAEATFGYPRAEAMGRPLAELIVPARLRKAHKQGMERYLQGGESRMLGRRVELTAVRADGSEFPVELAIAEAQGADGLVFIGYLRDITLQQEAEAARAKLEVQLRQAQKMEAIGHLAGGVAHDFNNILTGIIGYLGMAEDAVGSDDGRLQHYLQRARHSGARATELIQQMLTFSRGQRGDPRLLAPEAAVRDAMRLVRAATPATVSLIAELEVGLPAVLVDPVQVEQVLMNLCINARDAMQGKGTLEVGLKCVTEATAVCSSCQQAVSGRYVELRVADNGPGIPPEVLARMFEPFFTTKPPGQGSGMGLATVHGIIHEYRGHLMVRNRPGGGTEFRVLLPAFDTAADSPPEPAARGEEGQRTTAALQGRVLLAEDDPLARAFMTDLLRHWGLDVAACEDPLTARAAARAGLPRFDVAILDYTMPHMTGLELARQLHADDPELPMLLYSGYAEGLEDGLLADAGICARLAKPVDTALLFQHLKGLLGP